MCDHLACHGGKVKIRRVIITPMNNDGEFDRKNSIPVWIAAPGDGWPFASENTWIEALEAAKEWLLDKEGIVL